MESWKFFQIVAYVLVMNIERFAKIKVSTHVKWWNKNLNVEPSSGCLKSFSKVDQVLDYWK